MAFRQSLVSTSTNQLLKTIYGARSCPDSIEIVLGTVVPFELSLSQNLRAQTALCVSTSRNTCGSH